LEERGVVIRMVDINEADCTLDLEDLRRKLSDRTKLVAVGLASNAVGTINPVAEIVRMAHEFGALVYADAVHYAPHGLIDVKKLDCDFLVCSTYKFFGPHMGVLYGKREHLEKLHPYKVRALSNTVPVRWEWGTLNHECIAGITACVDYFADIGRRANPTVKNRREAIRAAFETVHSYERSLMEKLLQGLREIPGAKVYGITDPARFDLRCPTIAVRIAGHSPLELATKLGERGFFTWDGNYYAINLSERLDVEKDGGFLRIGLVHYNTMEEVERLIATLKAIV
jgi:cysteine desulfurase family protein (TIGR01976 family)